jgi:hypothetical protein
VMVSLARARTYARWSVTQTRKNRGFVD